MDHDQMMKMMYNVYTVNGKSGSLIQPLEVKEGERVRLRFINAGYLTHLVHVQGQTFQVVATDGNPIANPSPVQDKLLSIGAGERYDVTFVAGAKDFAVDLHDQTNGAKTAVIPVHVVGSTPAQPVADQADLPVLDLKTYGQNTGHSLDNGQFDKSYTLHLNSIFKGNDQVYTINGKTWPDTDPLEVRKGDRVKVTLINDGKSDHPMHLHGQTFQVLRYNGKTVIGDFKDTLLVRPGETYEIAFTADNPGTWAFHCHDLHHAAAGMMTLLKYQDYQSNYQIDLSKVGE
ncbi:MAG: multicopper oxidase domain-containing protein [Alicyclobacillaceae bacterium]|nr:multicopper oxidase domain-containing protein [Alicyclobacillaceae bacterium]